MITHRFTFFVIYIDDNKVTVKKVIDKNNLINSTIFV